MSRLFKTFRDEEDGNTTVDWIVLTAGLMMLSTAILATVAGGTGDLAQTAPAELAIHQASRAI